MPAALKHPSWLELALAPLAQVNAAVMGDFCLDSYWLLDTETVELSVETGLPVRRVRTQRYSLGGAGNVVANLADLAVRSVRAIGVVGTDLFGAEMLRILEKYGVNTQSGMVVDPDWQTMVYSKPCAGPTEESRIDFGAFNTLGAKSIDALSAAVEEAAAASDVVILNQQVPAGVSPPEVIERVNEIIAKFPRTHFIVDARHRPHLYRGAILKLNASEAAQYLGKSGETIFSESEVRGLALSISQKTGKPVFLTRGEHGIVVAQDGAVQDVPGIQVLGDTDTVGAGDTVVSALAAALGSGQDPLVAARLANTAAMVTVQKLQTTGTATPAEILAVGPAPDYIFEPELAEAHHLARFIEGTEIEHIGPVPQDLAIEHCIFDHDGTISTLREGWETVMEPMMVRAILGAEYENASGALFADVTGKVRRLIDRTTGIQTLMQMKGLVDLVRAGGFVPESDILDEHGYKKIFNDDLMKLIHRRVAKLANGELVSTDFQIKNAGLLIRELHQRGIKLYLASGTDQADVVAEATAMGHADLFEGRIFGSVGDIKADAKKMVLERIVRENNLAGQQFATFGDGPVEMRETQKVGGLCVGVASDELRRFGWNKYKRTRLIRAGASLLVPDFSQMNALLKVLHLA
jgi:rfaE bifunctional protein kinase chain/domain